MVPRAKRSHRLLVGAAVAAGILMTTVAPAFALGHRGDPQQISALRNAGPSYGGRDDSGTPAAPEIDGGVCATAIALVVGGLLLVLDRRQQ